MTRALMPPPPRLKSLNPRRNPARILAAAVLLAAAAALLLLLSSPAPGHAQTTDQLLLGNTGGTSGLGSVNVGASDTTQPFKTGKNPTGYTLTRIQLGTDPLSGDDTAPSASEITVTLRADSSGDPAGSALATFSFPDTWTPGSPTTGGGLNEFTLATAYDLDPDTTYHIHIAATKRVHVNRSAASQVDGGSASGWSFSAQSYLDADGDWVAGTGALTMELHGTIKATVPGKPTGLTATDGHRAVKVDWTAPADGGSPITGYEYTIDDGATDDGATFVATGSTGTSHILDNLAVGTYAFRVRAVNAVGEGDLSSAVTFYLVPASVIIVGFGATIEGADAVFTLIASKPVLSSSKPLNVRVSVSESGDMVASADEGAQTVSFALNATTAKLLVPTMDDGAAESDSVVTMAIQTDADYTVGAPSSSTVTVSDAESLPGPPTGVTASEGHRVVELDWTAPANDGGSAITRYAGRFSWPGNSVILSLGDSTSYTLLLLGDRDFTVEVRAVNAAENGRWSSPVTFTKGPATVNLTGGGGVVEGTDAAFTLTASRPVLSADRPLNVSVSVSESGDQVASADEGARTVSFAEGETTAALSVPTVGDTVYQGASMVTAAIRSDPDYTVGPDSSGTVRVADDEPRPVSAGSALLNSTTEQAKSHSTKLGHVRTFQEFKTGVHPGGYELHSIKVEGASKFGVFPSGLTATVRKYAPWGPVVAALNNPSSWAAGMNEFTAPANTILSSRTNYVVHFSQSSAGYIRAGVNGNFCVDNHTPDWDCYVGPDGWNQFDHPVRGVWTGTVGIDPDDSPWGIDGNALRFSIEGLPAGRSGQEPSPPENLSAQPCERKYSNLSWTAPFGSPDRYEIRSSGSSSHLWDSEDKNFYGNNFAYVHHTTETEYRHTARHGITYYTVRAVNASGPGMWSAVDQSNLWGDDDGGRSCEQTSQQQAAEVTPEPTGLPVITGTVEAGETLTADTSGIADFWGLDNAVFTYQWLADGEELPGATSATHTLADADAGRAISVRVTFTDDSGNAGTLTGTVTSEARHPNTPATGAPAIRGKAKVWDTLTADTSGIADEDGLTNPAFGYRWLANGREKSGATGSTYNLAASDAGKAITVRVTFIDDAGNAETLTSAAVELDPDDYTMNAIWEVGTHGVIAVGGSATGVVEVPGDRDFFAVNLSKGQTYRIDVAGHGDADALEQVRLHGVFLYAEELECSGAYEDPGVTTYVLTAGHSELYSLAAGAEGDGTGGYRVSVSESGDTGTGCDTEPVASAQAANTPATGAPAISGAAQVGETLTADTSVIADEDGLDSVTFSYQWQSDSADISGATDATYTLADSDVGKTITVQVSFTDDAGNEETLTSAATAAVEAKPNSPATGAPAITGTAQVGETLTADLSGIADEDGLANAAFAYQWQSDDAEIAGATGATYAPTDSDAGKTITVQVSFTDDAGNEEELTSAATDAVEPETQEAQAANNPATGLPTISGIAQVGVKLTADLSGIADVDGVVNATLNYQWQADGADIPGETLNCYTPVDADEGKTISVVVSFTDDAGNDEELTSAATAAVEARPNRPAMGALTITGTARVGELLTADVSSIKDDDGLDRAAFAYQWQADGTDLSGATGSSYTLAASDEGKAMSVTVSFTDYAGHEESFTSTATAAVVAAAEEDEEPTDRPHGLTAEASDGAVVLTWTAPVVDYQVSSYHILRHRPEQGEAEPLVYVDQTPNKDTSYTDTDVEAGVLYVYRVKAIVNWQGDLGEASDAAQIRAPATAQEQTANNPATGAPTISGTTQVGETLTADLSGIADDDGLSNAVFSYQWQADGADISDATSDTYTLAEADEGKAVSVKVSFTDDAGNDETLTSAATAAAEAKPNTPATGQPTISGTAQVGETLTADTSGIADEDGLDSVSYSYQWLADDSNISGATGETYTLADADEGKAMSVTVSFTDDRGHGEELSSAATDAVEAKPNTPATGAPTITGTAQVGETMTADTSGISDDDGLSNAVFSYQWQADGADISEATDSTYTLADLDEGKAISVTVSFTDDAGHKETLTSAATAAVEAKANSPATGAPVVTGTAQVGETLTAETSGIADEDGLDNVAFSYQWVSNDGGADTDIQDATASTYILADADIGKAISVKVSFTDDRGHREELTSAATDAVAGLPPPPLTASLENVATSHDGENVFTFELRFSEEFGLSYKTLRDHAFTVTGGAVRKAQRLEQGSNMGWKITVRPDGNGQVVIVLPETTDCDAQGAICTEDGRKLSHRLELTVGGPGQ